MLRQINIQLIEKIKKPIEGNRILNGIMNVLVIILFPIILIVGVLIMVFVGIFAFFQKLFSKPETKLELELGLETESTQIEQWNILTNLNEINIYQKYVSEIRFGPAYLNLKSEPKIEFLENKLFGDWFFIHSNGILLQQWNSSKKPNTNLVYIGIDNLKVKVLKKNIPSVIWKIVETKDKTLELNCDTGKEILTYKIEIKNVG